MLSKGNEIVTEQRSDEWFEMRKGRFTASQISRLLGKETLAKTKQSIDAFAFEKAVETVYGVEEDTYTSTDMERGTNLEPLAFNRFKDIKSFDFINVRESGFFTLGDHAGASPDGIVSNNRNLEIKCPRRNKFYKIVANGITEMDASYYAQQQMQMLCSGTESSYFFNYYLYEGLEYWHELTVERDEKMCDLIQSRILMATEIKLSYISKLDKNSQW